MKSNSRVVAWSTSRTIRLFDYSTIVLLFAASLALYARTMAPGLLDGDEGEFQVNIFRLGVSHTGYPTFFLLGKLWTILVPIGTIATRANLFSAFWGALTTAALFIFIRFLTGNRWAAIICALLLAASRVEWSQAIIPRPYTMNSFFVIVVPFLFFLWRVGKLDLTVPVFAFGLSLTNHRTMIWFAPAIAFFVLWHARGALFKPRRLLGVVIAFVLPLVLYGYVFWRGESDVGVEFHMKDFGDMVLGGNAREWWRFGPLDWVIGRITNLYIPLLIEQFTALGFVAGLVGAGALIANHAPRGWPRALPPREVFLFILLANLGNSAFGVFFDTIDVEKFFLPSYITFLFFIGVGIAVISEQLTVNSQQFKARGALFTVYCLLFTAFILLVVNNFPRNDWSGRTDVARAWDENLAQPLEEHALIVGSWESLTPLEYAMYVDGHRRDLERWKVITKNYLLDKAFYDSRQADIEKQVREGRPVYLTVYPGETETLGALVDKFRLTRVGDLWRVLDAPPSDIAMINELRTSKPIAVFTDREGRALELLGYGIHPTPAFRAGDFGLATLYWRVPQSFAGRLSISLRLTDAENHLISQRDLEPASGLRPTNGWLPNEVVQDDAGFFIPPDAPPGTYHLTIVVYDAATGENLKTERGFAFALNDLNVARTLDMPSRDVLQIPHALDVPLPPLRLLGYALGNEQPKGGDVLDLSLWWQLDQPTAHGEEIVLKLRDASGKSTELYRGMPIGNFPASEWGRAAILRGRYSIMIPIDASGKKRLVVESERNSKEIKEINVEPSGRTFAVPRISHSQVALIGDSIKLLGYDLDKTRLHPGDSVRLTLYWQALKQPTASYTVFAHALDASGTLRGQKDALPRDGALPTDRWLPGEVIADSYDIAIAPDAPSGDFQFEVGMYSAETGTRVSVTDTTGARVQDDRILLRAGNESK